MMNTKITIFAGALALAAASCTVGPDYQRPPLEVPAGYRSAAPEDAKAPKFGKDWWKLFGDPTLTRLEEQAIGSNQDLKAAVARVAEARAAARIAGSESFPALTFDPSADRTRSSGNVARAGGKASTSTDLRLPFDLSYEVDLWGRVRRSIEAAEAQALASVDNLAVVLHTIEADVALNYFTLRSLDSQIQIVGRTVESYQRQITLLQTQFKAGLVGRINIVQAESQLYAAQSQLTDLRRQRADVEHALATLIGRPPTEVTLAPQPLEQPPPAVPAGLPADLLRRRPDVAEAEQTLAAASAQIGVAVAQFYPDLRLTSTAGFESLDVRHLADWQSRIWSIGAGALVPIFAGGRLRANLRQAEARYDEMVATYRSSILVAFREVEDALTDLHLRADAAKAQAQAVESSREYLRLAETQYQQGLQSYFLVIDAERTLLSNELLAAQILNQRMASTVLLIKALGAGWDPEEPAAAGEEP
jgi:multidrug efflux system outer membrane protein